MTSALFNNNNGPFANTVDGFVYPQFINANRSPTSQDIYPPGTRWQDNSVTPKVIYETTGAGTWPQGGNSLATTTSPGIVYLSTYAQLAAGTAPSTAYVPSANDVFTYVNSVVTAGAPIAQTGVTGIVNLATNAQAVAGTATVPGVTALAVQPSNLASVFAAPPAIGGTTPAAAVFTTLGFTTATGTAGGTWASGGTAISIGADATLIRLISVQALLLEQFILAIPHKQTY